MGIRRWLEKWAVWFLCVLLFIGLLACEPQSLD